MMHANDNNDCRDVVMNWYRTVRVELVSWVHRVSSISLVIALVKFIKLDVKIIIALQYVVL